MKILVIGGSYFLGKYFVELVKKDNEVTLLNRGNKPMNDASIKEIVGDRHAEETYSEIKGLSYDVIVDFCAYQKGDIEFTVNQFDDKSFQYIFISTSDVYERGLNKELDETAPFEKRDFPGEEGAYIKGKISLEEELPQVAEKEGINYTVIRPAIIFGPDNYAPREDMYFFWIKNAKRIIHPSDATGEFQFAYVKDVAKAISLCMGNEKAKNAAFNVCNEEYMTYEKWMRVLKDGLGLDFEATTVGVIDVLEKQIPLPFPLIKSQSNWYNGRRIKELGLVYSDFTESLRETYESSEHVN